MDFVFSYGYIKAVIVEELDKEGKAEWEPTQFQSNFKNPAIVTWNVVVKKKKQVKVLVS